MPALLLTLLLLPAAALAQITVSIERSSAQVEEGNTVTFTLRASSAPASAITVTVSAETETGTGFELADPADTSGSGTVTTTAMVEIPANGTTATLELRVVENTTPNREGYLRATVLDGDDYDVATQNHVDVHIIDDDSIMSIEPIAPDFSVTEGGSVTLTVRASFPSVRERDVRLETSMQGDFGFPEEGPYWIKFAPGNTTQTIVATIEDDLHSAGQGELTVRMFWNDTWHYGDYRINRDDPTNSVSMAVLDNDSGADPYVTPTITIALHPDNTREDGNAYVKEGSEAKFIVTSHVPVTATIRAMVWARIPKPHDNDYQVESRPQGNPKWATIEIGQTTATLVVEIKPKPRTDTAADPGMLTAEIGDSTSRYWYPGGAYVTTNPASIVSMVILDDDTPVSISSQSATPAVEGSGSVTFTLTAGHTSPVVRPVNVALSGNGAAFVGESMRVVDIPAGTTTAMFDVELGNDDIISPSGGMLTAEVRDGEFYNVGSPSRHTVTVQDNDSGVLRLVDISGSAGYEGGSASITLTSSHIASEAYPVTVALSIDVGDYELEGETMTQVVRTVQFNPNATTSEFTVRIAEDTVAEEAGRLTARVVAVPDTSIYGVDIKASSITLDIVDDDAVASIAPRSDFVREDGNAYVKETSQAWFDITFSHAAPVARVVRLNVGLEGGYMRWSYVWPTLEPGEFTVSFRVNLRPDDTARASGRVTVTLTEPYTQHKISASSSSASMIILDDDTPVSVSSESTAPVAEGGSVTFTLTASHTAAERSVTVALSADNGFEIAGESTRVVEFSPDSTTATFDVTVADNDLINPSGGTLTAEVRDGEFHNVGTPSQHPVTIADEEAGSLRLRSLTAGPGIEGGPMLFTLTVSHAVSQAWELKTRLDVTQGHFALQEGTGGVDYQFPAYATSSTFAVNILQNMNTENSGELMVTLVQGSGSLYQLTSGGASSVTAAIVDDDATITLEPASAPSLTEGDTATFTLRASHTATVARDVSVDLVASNGFAVVGSSTRAIEFPADETTHTFDVTLADDEVANPSGTLTVTIQDGAAYEVGATPSVTVDLIDNEGDPDVNASGSVDANDALILYYAYSLRNDLGTGR